MTQTWSHRTWATTSSLVNRQSGRKAEFALTTELNVKPRAELRGGNAGRTERAQDIFFWSTILQLFFRVLDELRSYFMHIRPILSKSRNSWTLVPFHRPTDESLWCKLGGEIYRK